MEDTIQSLLRVINYNKIKQDLNLLLVYLLLTLSLHFTKKHSLLLSCNYRHLWHYLELSWVGTYGIILSFLELLLDSSDIFGHAC